MVKSLPIRSEVPLEETWNLNDLFESEEDFSTLLLEIEEEVNDFEKKCQKIQKKIVMRLIKMNK